MLTASSQLSTAPIILLFFFQSYQPDTLISRNPAHRENRHMVFSEPCTPTWLQPPICSDSFKISHINLLRLPSSGYSFFKVLRSLPVHWYHLFVPIRYHINFGFARVNIVQNNKYQLVHNTETVVSRLTDGKFCGIVKMFGGQFWPPFFYRTARMYRL